MTAIARLQRMNHGRNFRAFSLRGGEAAESIDPFLAVDHAWMNAPTFPPHPHAGFSAVSYLFLNSETGVANRDSLGARNLIRPGGLHWTAAGRGVVHEELPAEPGKTVHMLQIFVNLAVERQSAPPFALSLEPEDVPVMQLPGIQVRVPLGGFGEKHSPLMPPTNVTLLDINLGEGAELIVPVAANHSAFIMPIHGALAIDGERFESDQPRLPVFPPQGEMRTVKLQAPRGPANAVLFAGHPLHQPVHWQGPMALASPEALGAALAAFQRGEFGSL
jgi:redox-sensitive bicupin YhaK (pirin superfamily)